MGQPRHTKPSQENHFAVRVLHARGTAPKGTPNLCQICAISVQENTNSVLNLCRKCAQYVQQIGGGFYTFAICAAAASGSPSQSKARLKVKAIGVGP